MGSNQIYKSCSCNFYKAKETINKTTTYELEENICRSSHCGSAETNPTSNHEDTGSSPGPAQRAKDPVLP